MFTIADEHVIPIVQYLLTVILKAKPIQALDTCLWMNWCPAVPSEASWNAELYLNVPWGAIKSCNFFVRPGWPHYPHQRKLRKKNIICWILKLYLCAMLHFKFKHYCRHSHCVRLTNRISSNSLDVDVGMVGEVWSVLAGFSSWGVAMSYHS